MLRYHLLAIVVCLGICFPKLGNGLKCITCDDCDKSPGSSQECESSKYVHIPDDSRMACSYETLKGGEIRKRCTLIRKSPSGAANKKIHCYSSPLNKDKEKEDCVCFCDDCNKDKPDPSKKESCDTENGGNGVRNKLKSFIGIMCMFLGLLLLIL
ncbi:hypothetical protein Ocin01_14412 [Orchesella cincta]|uniref:Protein sleepless n=1 Tax=Orchesella cincta TaxID=48709 RepID=A0A1D2MGZ9_ORCCI|nr:hypothetical protein Ocin01_14412 [Orchesella cincta]